MAAHYQYTNRGNKVLVLNNIKFRYNGYAGSKIRWRCASHEKLKCKAVVHTVDDVIVRYIDTHAPYDFEEINYSWK